MKGLRRFAFGNTTRNVITYTLYVAFTVYTGIKLFQEPSMPGKATYAILLILFLGIALWAEYLRFLYRQMISALTMDCNLNKADLLKQDLIKKDFFHAYRNTLYIFDTLYFMDQEQPQACIEIMEDHYKFFHNSLDTMLIYNYTCFMAHYKLGNKTKVKSYYTKTTNMKGAKIKGNKLSPLYSWEYIDAIYYVCIHDDKKAKQAFDHTNIENLNHRELTHYYFEYAKLCEKLHLTKEAKQYYEQAVYFGNTLVIAKEAKQKYKKVTL